MLTLYHASDLESLSELASHLLAQPLSDPFAAANIVIPSQGMGRWLTLQIAREQGIAMQLNLQLPASFIWTLARTVLGELPEQSAFKPETLTWRLYDWLCEERNLSQAPALARYLQQADERRRLTLAARIADVFDQYLLYRDDWLAAWERGEHCQLGADEDWQALLWRELTRNGHPHRARILEALLARLHDNQPIAALPERLLVFGVSNLPPHHLRVFEALARHTEVIIMALNPCREAWGDIRNLRELARQPALDPNDWYLDVGHPLLASLGRQGRDFFDQLFALANGENARETGIYPTDDELTDDSLLHAIQQDVLRLRQRRPDERLTLRDDDRSLELHIAHSPLREVEILHDQLLARFADDPSLTPDQVVVLTPDIERYAPFIDAVFASRTPHIPYSLSDRSLRAEQPLLDNFLSLLELPSSRFTGEEVLSWLEQPAIAGKMAIEAEDLPLLRDWLRDAAVRWGRDAGHRAALGLPEDSAFTWQQGLDRLLLGFSAPDRLTDGVPLLGGIWPLDRVEGSQARLLGRFAQFVAQLQRLAVELQRPRPLQDWAARLQQLLDELYDEQEAGDALALLSQTCHALAGQAEAADIQRPLELSLIRQQLSTALEQGSAGSGFLNGAVTFCNMVPMRSLPYRHICLLGLNDGALPRRTPSAGFDLIARHPRCGDRARRLDDRYLLLETLLSARDSLYLSYVGRDPRSNDPLPPSVLVSELLEAAEQAACPASGNNLRARICIEHPLQPFAPGNFSDDRQRSYSATWFRAAETLSTTATDEPPFALPLPAADDHWLTLEPAQLLNCFRHPARFLLEQRLPLRLPQSRETLAAEEPFELERETLAELRRLALRAAESGWTETEERQLAAASGRLPSGELGQALWGQLRGPIQAFAPTLLSQRPTQTPFPLLIDIQRAGVHLYGWLDGVTDSGLFDYRLRALGPWELATFWLRHLLLNAAAGPEQCRESRLLSPQGDWRLAPLDDPLERLEPWLNAYRQALCEPLPLFSRSSYGFVKKLRQPGRKTPLEAARLEARVHWLGNDYLSGEIQDPWNALAFRGRDALGEPFEELAQQLYGPAFDALQEDTGQ